MWQIFYKILSNFKFFIKAIFTDIQLINNKFCEKIIVSSKRGQNNGIS